MVTYAYDGDGVLIQRAERVGSRSTWVNPLYDRTGLPKIIATKDGDWWAWNGVQPLATSTGGHVTYVVADIKHDVRLGTDTTGTVSGRWAFDVDGNPTTGTPDGLWVGWNSELTDTTTGNVWLRARWYDPATARFLTADPWMGNPAEPISLNRYLYANADPVNLADPTGLFSMTEEVAVIDIHETLVMASVWRATAVAAEANALRAVLIRATWYLAGGVTLIALATLAVNEGIDGDSRSTKPDIGLAPDIEHFDNDGQSHEPKPEPAADGAGDKDPPSCVPTGWTLGDDVYDQTRAGNEPSWSTVRARFWKNEAIVNASEYSVDDLSRMRRGLAPRRYNPDKGGWESMELSHEPTPRCEGGIEFVPRWPQDHASVDPHRYPGY